VILSHQSLEFPLTIGGAVPPKAVQIAVLCVQLAEDAHGVTQKPAPRHTCPLAQGVSGGL